MEAEERNPSMATVSPSFFLFFFPLLGWIPNEASASPTFSPLSPFFFLSGFSFLLDSSSSPRIPSYLFSVFSALLPYFLSSFYLFFFPLSFCFSPDPRIPSYLFSLKHGKNHGCVGDHMSPTMSPTFFFYYIYFYYYYFFYVLFNFK